MTINGLQTLPGRLNSAQPNRRSPSVELMESERNSMQFSFLQADNNHQGSASLQFTLQNTDPSSSRVGTNYCVTKWEVNHSVEIRRRAGDRQGAEEE